MPVVLYRNNLTLYVQFHGAFLNNTVHCSQIVKELCSDCIPSVSFRLMWDQMSVKMQLSFPSGYIVLAIQDLNMYGPHLQQRLSDS